MLWDGADWRATFPLVALEIWSLLKRYIAARLLSSLGCSLYMFPVISSCTGPSAVDIQPLDDQATRQEQVRAAIRVGAA